MGLLGKLIVNIDADLGGLRKQIKEAERTMRNSARSLGDLSSNLTQAISLPFAAIGIGSIKAAADLNKLTDGLATTMQGAGRSVFSVQNEIVELRKAALAPGLDFEQAVKGSLRLQGVGKSAEAAREILVQFGNAIAVSGGSAAELDAVTRQLSQIIGKGKILNEDLVVLKENMPSVSKAMVEAFGTADAEGLSKLGISTDQFVDRLTKQLSSLPRATGGLANGLTNAFNAIKQGAADVGNVLATKLNLVERLDQFANFVGGIADAFKELSPFAQDVVVYLGLFAVALGPAIKIGSLFVSTIGSISVAIAQMRLAMSAVQTGGLIGWFQSLNAVMKANIIGVVVGVALAAAAAFALLNAEVSTSTKIQQTIAAVQKEAVASISEERVKTGLLIDVLKSETASREEKAAALAKLNQIAPEYFKGLNAEKINVDQLNFAYDRYIEGLLRAARAKAAEGKLIELDKKALEVEERRQKLRAALPQSAASNLQLAQGGFVGATGQRQSSNEQFIKAADEEAASIKQQMDALKALIKTNTDLVPSEATKTKAVVQSAAALKEADKQAKVYAEALSDIQKEIDKAALTGGDAFEAQANAIESGLSKILDAGFSKNSAQVQKFVGLMAQLKASVQTIGPLTPLQQITPDAPVSLTAGQAPASPIAPVPVEVLDSYARLPEYLQVWQDKVAEAQLTLDSFWESNGAAMQAASEAMLQFGDTIESSLADANTSWADFGTAAKAAIVGVIGNLIKLAVASAVTNAFRTSPNPLLGAGLAAIAGGLAAGLFKRLVGAAKFARGTLHAPEGMALVGEEGPELLNLPARSGIRLAAKQASTVQSAIQRAVSGPVQSAAGLSVVGQRGPEYVYLPAGAQVIPAPQTKQVLAQVREKLAHVPVSMRKAAPALARVRRVEQYFVGTLHAPGGVALVGEEGPELLNLPRQSGTRVSNLTTNSVLANFANTERSVSRSQHHSVSVVQMLERSLAPLQASRPHTVRAAQAVTNHFAPLKTIAKRKEYGYSTRRANLATLANVRGTFGQGKARRDSPLSAVQVSVSQSLEPLRVALSAPRLSRATGAVGYAVRQAMPSLQATLNVGGLPGQRLSDRMPAVAVSVPRFSLGNLPVPGSLSIVDERAAQIVRSHQSGQHLHTQPAQQQVFEQIQGKVQPQQVEVGGTFRVIGTDLVLVLEKAERNNRRLTGK